MKRVCPTPLFACWPPLMSLITAIVPERPLGSLNRRPYLPTTLLLRHRCEHLAFYPRTSHCLYLQLTHLLSYETNPKYCQLISNVPLAQRFVPGSCNNGRWCVVLHQRIRLSLTSWQPGGSRVWLPHWLVLFVSFCKMNHVPFDLFLISVCSVLAVNTFSFHDLLPEMRLETSMDKTLWARLWPNGIFRVWSVQREALCQTNQQFFKWCNASWHFHSSEGHFVTTVILVFMREVLWGHIFVINAVEKNLTWDFWIPVNHSPFLSVALFLENMLDRISLGWYSIFPGGMPWHVINYLQVLWLKSKLCHCTPTIHNPLSK